MAYLMTYFVLKKMFDSDIYVAAKVNPVETLDFEKARGKLLLSSPYTAIDVMLTKAAATA